MQYVFESLTQNAYTTNIDKRHNRHIVRKTRTKINANNYRFWWTLVFPSKFLEGPTLPISGSCAAEPPTFRSGDRRGESKSMSGSSGKIFDVALSNTELTNDDLRNDVRLPRCTCSLLIYNSFAVSAYPLKLQHTHTVYVPNVIIVGDACLLYISIYINVYIRKSSTRSLINLSSLEEPSDRTAAAVATHKNRIFICTHSRGHLYRTLDRNTNK